LNYKSPYIKICLRITVLLLLVGIFFSNAVLQISTGLFLPFIIYLVMIKGKERGLRSIEKLILLLLLSGILSLFFSPIPSLAYKNIIRHCILLTIIPLFYLADNDDFISIDVIGKLVSVFALITAAYGIIRYINGAERAFGFFAGYYTLAAVLAFSLPITFASIFYSNHNWKYLAGISTFIQAAALWLTFTRSALLGIVIGSLVVIIFLLFGVNIPKPVRNKIIVTSTLFLSVIVILLLTTTDARINPIKIFSNTDISSGRSEIYNDAYNIVIADLKSGWENIFFGHGLNSRVILFPSSRYTSWESEYIESFMTQGLIGLLFVILVYYQFFKNLFNLQRKSSNSIYRIFSLGISVSGISFWIISFFSSQLLGQNSSAYFVVLYSLIILIERKIKEKPNQISLKS
jgi:hypothetical protein